MYQKSLLFYRKFKLFFIFNYRGTLDTEANREAMKNADFSKWTSCDSVADKIKNWVETENYPEKTFYKI